MTVLCVEALNFTIWCIISVKSFSECSAWDIREIFVGYEIEFALKDSSGYLLLGVVVSWLRGMLSSSSVLHHNFVLWPKFVKQVE
jgi:hypothetical protein